MTQRKTAPLLLAQMNEVLDILAKEWKVRVVAFTSDASGESRRARLDLQAIYPKLVVPDCYAHQVRIWHAYMHL
jgi:hypothetical protein